MAKYHENELLQQLTLGKKTEYAAQYSPNLLQAVPRSLNRHDIHLFDQLPFMGEDVWYGYELSWLNTKGKPQVAVAEFRIPCTSENLIESKSFKLYLNSFNQHRFDSWQQVEQHLQQDLSQCANAPVKVSLYNVEHCDALAIASIPSEYRCIDDLDINIEHYQYDPSLLKQQNSLTEQHLVSHLLKSNCLITNQPDWATIFIHYKGKTIDEAALLSYLISFRQHNEFHEQCVERIFTDLFALEQIDSLTVFARYTRRGGLDINPFRSTHLTTAPNWRTLRQ
jgi:7-cyano-7-deazaguanine reductase